MGLKTKSTLAGAGGGAAKGAAIGSVVPGIGTALGAGVGGLLGGLGGFFKGKGTEESGQAQREAAIAAGKLDAAKTEDRRQGALQGYQGIADQMAQRGFMTIDPAFLEQLGARRNYDELIEQAAVDPNAGAGSAFLAGLTDDIFDAGMQYAGNELTDTGITMADMDPALSTASPDEVDYMEGR